MAFTFTLNGNLVWRDYNTDGQSASGKFRPRKSDVRTWAGEVEAALDELDDDTNLSAFRGLTLEADRGVYATGADTLDLFTLTAAGRTFLAASSAAAQRAALEITSLPDPGENALAGWDEGNDQPVYYTVGAGLEFDTGVLQTNFTEAGLALLDDADAAAQRVTLGLGNVNNTSDANKPVSTAQQAAINAVADAGAPSFVLEDQRASGTDGGSSTTSWSTRVLNTEVRDVNNTVTLSSNEFTLTIDHWVEFEVTFFSTAACQARLFNVTDSVVVAYGISGDVDPVDQSQHNSMGGGLCEAGKTYRIEAISSNVRVNDGFGNAAGHGTEIYARVRGYVA
jgi:hypothetical protein